MEFGDWPNNRPMGKEEATGIERRPLNQTIDATRALWTPREKGATILARIVISMMWQSCFYAAGAGRNIYESWVIHMCFSVPSGLF